MNFLMLYRGWYQQNLFSTFITCIRFLCTMNPSILSKVWTDLKSFPHRHYKHGGFFPHQIFSLSLMFQKENLWACPKVFPVNTFTGFLFTILLHICWKAWLFTAISFTLGMFHPMKFLVLKENWALPEGLPTFLQSHEWISSQEWTLSQIKTNLND